MTEINEANETYFQLPLPVKFSQVEEILRQYPMVEAKLSEFFNSESFLICYEDMTRFVDENTVIGNCVPSKNGLEQRIKSALQKYGIGVIDFPYFSSSNDSAVGCYLNFLETERHIFLPVFDNAMDDKAITAAEEIFSKKIVPVNINEIAKEGGVLNCISWETKQTEKIQKIKSEKSLRPGDNFMKPALHF